MQSQRWAAIDEEGRYGWLGRGTEPSSADLLAVPVALDARDVAAWLIVVSGDYWFAAEVEVLAVRLLTRRECPANRVIRAFRRRRRDTLTGVGGAVHR